jgi:hypothetical protein
VTNGHQAFIERRDHKRPDQIITELVMKPDRLWADWKNGKAITPKALAGLLRPFGIFAHQLSVGGGKALRGCK